MDYLKINIRFRTFMFLLGLVSCAYGYADVTSGEASRKGLNSTYENAPISYVFTVGKKLVLGSILILVSLSPLLGKND
ncbi:MAG: hypothetical protein ACJAZB_002101 [Psychrosphaera sp.]|jgi:hypothetical protein